jgi:hypothetical protein
LFPSTPSALALMSEMLNVVTCFSFAPICSLIPRA